MSAIILKFPPRGRFDLHVDVEREANDLGWFVLSPDHRFGWLHGDWDGAINDARKIARDYGVAVISSAGRYVP